MLIASLAQSNLQISTLLKKPSHLLHDRSRLKQGESIPGTGFISPKLEEAKWRTTEDKLRDMLKEIHLANWTLSDFLYLVFRHKDADGK